MKKYLVFFLLFAIIIPSLASASWWNPFSWSIFHRTDPQTQALENRIKELEKRLEVSTTSVSTTTLKNNKKETGVSLPSKTEKSVGVNKRQADLERQFQSLLGKVDAMLGGTNKSIEILEQKKEASLKEVISFCYSHKSNLENLKKQINEKYIKLINLKDFTYAEKQLDSLNAKYDLLYRDWELQLEKNRKNTTTANTQTVVKNPSDVDILWLKKLLSEISTQQQERIAKATAELNELKTRTAPLSDKIQVLTTELLNCPIGTLEKQVRYECDTKAIELRRLSGELTSIQNDFALEHGYTTTFNKSFTENLKSPSGSYYKFYFDGRGGGSIYNLNDITESYKISCDKNTGTCSMLSN